MRYQCIPNTNAENPSSNDSTSFERLEPPGRWKIYPRPVFKIGQLVRGLALEEFYIGRIVSMGVRFGNLYYDISVNSLGRDLTFREEELARECVCISK